MTIDCRAAQVVLGLLLAFSSGCQTTKTIARPIAASDMQTHGVICGSFPNRRGDEGFTIRNLETGQVHAVLSQLPKSGFSKNPEDDQPDPFLLALPPGKYEIFRAHTRKMDWCEFEAPFDLAAGQILYVGEVKLDVKLRLQAPAHTQGLLGGALSTIELVNVTYSNATRDKDQPQVAAIDEMARDLRILHERHPEIMWQQAQNRVSIWDNLQVENPMLGKKMQENIRLQAQQKKADKAAGVQTPAQPVEVILQR